MTVKQEDFQFFSFFVGIQKGEIEKMKLLIDTFPYAETHKIFVIDKSRSAHKILNQKSNRFYDSPRSYFDGYQSNISTNDIDEFFNLNKDILIRIEQEDYTFHGTGVEKVIRKYADKKGTQTVVLLPNSDFLSGFHTDIFGENVGLLVDPSSPCLDAVKCAETMMTSINPPQNSVS